jgi:hypothetical protein
MGSFAFLDARLVVNGINLSSFLTSVTLNAEVEELEDTAFGDTWRSRKGGLKDWSLDLEFNNDFAAAAVDVTLWPLFGTVVPILLRPTSAAISATNPEYFGDLLVSQLTPLDGTVGDLAKNSVTWPGAGLLDRDILP